MVCQDTSELMYMAFIVDLMDGWITCHFMSFSTVFQSYHDDGR